MFEYAHTDRCESHVMPSSMIWLDNVMAEPASSMATEELFFKTLKTPALMLC